MNGDGEIRTVNLRILRDGPTHNHLLSPLTAYLAVVGPYEAVSVRIPYEHRRLLRDLSALRYGATGARGPDVTRISSSDRRIIADQVGSIFDAVPGLTSEMATEPACDGALTHLCLVFSAAELSLLPFELATAPRGFPGEGFPLSIQSVAPVVMTRSIPGAIGRKCRWDREPKILFVASQPPGLPSVPVKAHLLGLLRCLRPWVGPVLDPSSTAAGRENIVSKHLTVLADATLSEIEEACRRIRFSHIHILAHSETFDEGSQTQFALALRGTDGRKELVSSERLQAALRLPMRRRAHDHESAHPLVVSLATCDSGNQSQVVFPTMSLAHALHAAGVPLVVGSLFPLSYRGSVVMTESLYGGLLAGRDPRRVLYDVRHDLFRMDEQTHDWASIVCYASLPEEQALDAQVQALGFRASRAGINASLLRGRDLTEGSSGQLSPSDAKSLADRIQQVDKAVSEAANDIPTTGAYALEGQGVLASTAKRRAELFWRAAVAASGHSERQEYFLEQSKLKLRHAQELYLRAARAPRWTSTRPEAELPTVHWVLTQALSLTMVLDHRLDGKAWWAADLDVDNYLDPNQGSGIRSPEGAQTELLWAHASRAELRLLAYGASFSPSSQVELQLPSDAETLRADALRHVRLHVEIATAIAKPELVKSTVNHLEHYTNWWFHELFVDGARVSKVGEPIRKLAGEMLTICKPPG